MVPREENLATTRIRSPNPPNHSESLYRYNTSARKEHKMAAINIIICTLWLAYCWLKLIDMLLFTTFVVMCLQTSDIERKCLYVGKKLRGLSPRANYTDRAAAAGRRS